MSVVGAAAAAAGASSAALCFGSSLIFNERNVREHKSMYGSRLSALAYEVARVFLFFYDLNLDL